MIKVGTCGWSVKGGRKKYFEKFKVIEIQQTFYNLPMVKTAQKWRAEAPEDFEFTLKVWQVITHPHTSPSWRRLRKKPPGKLENYGFLKPTRENFEAWEKFKEIANSLNAKIVIFQTPPSFGYNRENYNNIIEFFSKIKDNSLVIGWEPRGSWNNALDKVKEIVEDLGIIHVVDPFRRLPVSSHPITYFRLHGIGKGEVNYRYKYSDDDLEKLLKICLNFTSKGHIVYVMFNNVYMAEDALKFKQLAKERDVKVI